MKGGRRIRLDKWAKTESPNNDGANRPKSFTCVRKGAGRQVAEARTVQDDTIVRDQRGLYASASSTPRRPMNRRPLLPKLVQLRFRAALSGCCRLPHTCGKTPIDLYVSACYSS